MQASKRAIGAAAVLAVVLAACSGAGDDDQGLGPAVPTTEAAETADPRSQAELDADAATARAAVLTAEDVGDGWIEFPAEGDEPDGDDVLAQIGRCMGVSGDLLGSANPQATSSAFRSEARDEDFLVSGRVTLTPSEDDAVRVLDVLGRDQVSTCFEGIVAGEIDDATDGEGVTGTDITESIARSFEVGEGIGDGDAVAVRVTTSFVPVRAEGAAEEFAIDNFAELMVVRSGRAVVTLFSQSIVNPLPPDEADRLFQAMVERLAGATDADDDRVDDADDDVDDADVDDEPEVAEGDE